jgi:hypothetical protein
MEKTMVLYETMQTGKFPGNKHPSGISGEGLSADELVLLPQTGGWNNDLPCPFFAFGDDDDDDDDDLDDEDNCDDMEDDVDDDFGDDEFDDDDDDDYEEEGDDYDYEDDVDYDDFDE